MASHSQRHPQHLRNVSTPSDASFGVMNHNHGPIHTQVGVQNHYGDVHYGGSAVRPQEQEVLVSFADRDPRVELTQLLAKKDMLHQQSCQWVYENSDFVQWYKNDKHHVPTDTCLIKSPILWLHGDPGKGKSMIAIFLVQKITRQLAGNDKALTYFFCDSSSRGSESAVSVLRGLIYLLISENPKMLESATMHLNSQNGKLFEGESGFYALWRIFCNVLRDSAVHQVFVVIDGVDECNVLQEELLNLIVDQAPVECPKAQWLITSRNEKQIKRILSFIEPDQLAEIDLEAEHDKVSNAVNDFITWKIDSLSLKLQYSSTERTRVEEHLRNKANGTFLWVWLVCKELQKTARWKTIATLQTLPQGLRPLYTRAIARIKHANHDDEETLSFLRKVMCITLLAFKPLPVESYRSLADLPEEYFADTANLLDLIEMWGSFLTVRNGHVYLVHQSAREYLWQAEDSWLAQSYIHCGPNDNSILSPLDQAHLYLSRSLLSLLAGKLKTDLCGLQQPGVLRDDVESTKIEQCVPKDLAYACEHWIDHFIVASRGGRDVTPPVLENAIFDYMLDFFTTTYLQWLEVTSLLRKLEVVLTAMSALKDWIISARRASSSRQLAKLFEIIDDAHCFICYHKNVLNLAPLQVYGRSLAFSPASSIIRETYQKKFPPPITYITNVDDQWSPCMHVMEGHQGSVESVVFSKDGRTIASGSLDGTASIWDVQTGTRLHKFVGHQKGVYTISLSPDGSILASGSEDRSIRLWDTRKGTCIGELTGHRTAIECIAFSPTKSILVSASWSGVLRIWDTTKQQNWSWETLEGHSNMIEAIKFSADGTLFATGCWGGTLNIWESETGGLVSSHTMGSRIRAASLSNSGKHAAAGSDGPSILLVETQSGKSTVWHDAFSSVTVRAVVFSPDETRLAYASTLGRITLASVAEARVLHQSDGLSNATQALSFNSVGDKIIAGFTNGTIHVFSTLDLSIIGVLQGHSSCVGSLSASPINGLFASGSWDGTIRLWNDQAHKFGVRAFAEHVGSIDALAISTNVSLLALGSRDGSVQIWNLNSGKSSCKLLPIPASILLLAFSNDGFSLVAVGSDKIVRSWTVSGAFRWMYASHLPVVQSVSFSRDDKIIAITYKDNKALVFLDTISGSLLFDSSHGVPFHLSQDGLVAVDLDNNRSSLEEAISHSVFWNMEYSSGAKHAHPFAVTDLGFGGPIDQSTAATTKDGRHIILLDLKHDFIIIYHYIAESPTCLAPCVPRDVSNSPDFDLYLSETMTGMNVHYGGLKGLSHSETLFHFPYISTETQIACINNTYMAMLSTFQPNPEDYCIALWNIASGSLVRELRHPAIHDCEIQLTFNDLIAVIWGRGRRVIIWNITDNYRSPWQLLTGLYSVDDVISMGRDSVILVNRSSARMEVWLLGNETLDPQNHLMTTITGAPNSITNITLVQHNQLVLEYGFHHCTVWKWSKDTRSIRLLTNNEAMSDLTSSNPFSNTSTYFELRDCHTDWVRQFTGTTADTQFQITAHNDRMLVLEELLPETSRIYDLSKISQPPDSNKLESVVDAGELFILSLKDGLCLGSLPRNQYRVEGFTLSDHIIASTSMGRIISIDPNSLLCKTLTTKLHQDQPLRDHQYLTKLLNIYTRTAGLRTFSELWNQLRPTSKTVYTLVEHGLSTYFAIEPTDSSERTSDRYCGRGVAHQGQQDCAYSIDSSLSWILHKGSRVIRLPSNLKTDIYCCTNEFVVLGSKYGKLTILKLPPGDTADFRIQ